MAEQALREPVAAARRAKRSALVTFSGVDGGGKTTSSRRAEALLSERGLRCEWVEFIGLGASTRALRLLHRLRGTKPRARDFEAMARAELRAAPEARRRAPLRDARRIATHVLDALLMRRYLRTSARRGVEVVVCDRYFYDALVRWNLPDGVTRALERLVPEPDLAFLVEAAPETVARRRGPGADGVARLRSQSYERAALRHPRWVRLPCLDLAETQRLIARQIDAWRTAAVGDPAGSADR